MRPSSFFLLAILACSAAPASTPPAPPVEGTVNPVQFGTVDVTLRSGDFRLEDIEGGQQIVMEGFGQIREAGRPLLPRRQALILLPPGARALSLAVTSIDSAPLPGSHIIAAAPPLIPLANGEQTAGLIQELVERREAVRQEAYSHDRAWPDQVAGITGNGSLRKYSYVRVAFHPFAYQALSGRLEHRRSARIQVHYVQPAPDSAAGRAVRSALSDQVADRQAASLFVNYDDLRELYQPGPAAAGADLPTHDLVIITTQDLEPAVTASSFPSYKTGLGFAVRIVRTTDSEITGQNGADLAEKIRNFLRAYYIPWGIEHVLLVGNYLDVPMRYCYPDPDNHLHDPSNPGVGPGSVPTDMYYADLSLPDAESWDLDGDGFHGEYLEDMPDFLAEVNVGRIPTSQTSRITYTLNKMVAYEQDTGAWKRNALHAGAVLFYENQDFSGIPFRDGAVCVDEIEKNFMQDWTMSRYSEQQGLTVSVCPWPQLTLTSFITDWRNGTYGIVNWAGHGWPDQVARTVWSADDGDGVPETDGSDALWSDAFLSDLPIYDDDYPSIVCAVSCDVGYPDPNPYGNIGINMLTDPGTGSAAGIVSSSRYAAVSSDWPALPGGAESLCYEFNRYLIAAPDGLKSLGAALFESKFYSHTRLGWDNHYEYRNLYDYNLYGDPSMDWRGAGTRTGDLLRNSEIWQLDPVTPPVGDVLPLDPVDDRHATGFVSGAVDSDPATGAALVFYSIDAPVRIYLTRMPSGEIRIEF